MNEEERMSWFIGNLKPELAKFVYLKECKTIEEAYDQANLCETYANERNDYANNIYFSASTSTNNFGQSSQNNNNFQNNFKQQQQINKTQQQQQQQQQFTQQSTNLNPQVSNNNIKKENINEICCICKKPGHIGENCRNRITCSTCNMKGHTAEVCRQHLSCTRCLRKGHVVENCFARTMAKTSYMAISNDNFDIIKWKAKINDREVVVALDNGATKSVMSLTLVKSWNLSINDSSSIIETSSGEHTESLGCTDTLNTEFEGIQANISFIITNIKAVDVLLGVDWFKQTGVLLDPKNNAFILPQRQVISRNELTTYNDEEDLSYTLNMMCMENDEMEFIDDYTCFNSSELDLNKMAPKSQISNENVSKFKELLLKNKSIFAISTEQLGCFKGVEFNIETTSETPIYSVPYRQPPALTNKMKEEVESLMKAGLIRKGSAGTWASPSFMIMQNGKGRMVTNYKELNAITIPFKFPLPRIDDQLDSFQGTKFFATTDTRKGFNQMTLSEQIRHKAGFITPFGLFEPNRLPFGLTNGPAYFSAAMQNILSDLPFVRVYIDDITIASKSEDEHLMHIEKLFNRLEEFNLKLNPDKCTFFATEIKLLGHIVDQNGIKMDPIKIEAIANRKEPNNLKTLQSFLGATNYYRKFILHYSHITAPLHKLTSSQVKWQWNSECKTAHETLKKKLIEYPILRSPDFSRPFIVHTDASHVALGATLAQLDEEGNEYACYYASKLLKDSERAYGIAELECLAIVWAINTFRIYLYTEKFTIYTDNAALKWLLTLNNPSSRLTRWAIMLSQFRFEIKHRPGKSHCNADMLSRPVLLSLQRNELAIEQQSTKLLDPYDDPCLLNYLIHRRHVAGASRKQVKRVEKSATLYKIKEDGTIMARKNRDHEFTITIPKPENREEIILKEHELQHSKSGKIVYNLSSKNIFWKNMEKQIDDLISLCEVCIRYDKIIRQDNPATAIHIDNIFERWGLDVVSGLPLSKEGYSAILVVIEYLTKFPWAFPLKHKSAEEIAGHLMKLICTFGPPNCLLSDQGKEFLNIVVQTLCEKFGIIKRNTSSYNPRTNGLCERTNQALTRGLVKHAEENPTNWPESLEIVLLGYRTTIHASTKHSPFQLMFGRRFGQFDDWLVKEENNQKASLENRLAEIKKLFDITQDNASQQICKAQQKQVNTQNNQTNASHNALMEGDIVYLKNCKLVKNKFEPLYSGPYTIAYRIESSGNYVLATMKGEIIKDSYPRWKLKAKEIYNNIKIANNTTTPSTNTTTTTAPSTKINNTTAKTSATTAPSTIINTSTTPSTKTSTITEPSKIINSTTTPSTNTTKVLKEQKPLYRILNVQPIGRGHSYEIKYSNGKTKWIPGKEMDPDILADYNKIKNRQASNKGIRITTPIIAILITLFCCICNTSASVETSIIDKFIYCQSKEINRILDPYPECIHPAHKEKINGKREQNLEELMLSNKIPSTIFVLSKNKYYINEIGHQCYKSKKTIWLNETWTFKPSRLEEKKTIHLTRLECMTMIESKICNENPMTCNDDGCWYVAQTIEEYSWNQNAKKETFDCAFHKKQVIAETKESQLYFSPTNTCKPKDLYCKLYDSIIIWSNETKKSCPFTKIHTGTKYSLSQLTRLNQHNILFSLVDKLTFQIEKAVTECEMRMFQTTSDVYIIFENDPKAERHVYLEKAEDKNSFNKQHDINNLLLAELDNEKQFNYMQMVEIGKINKFYQCVQFKNQLNIIAKDKEAFNELYDPNGNLLRTFTSENIIYLPFCSQVSEIIIKKQEKCFKEIPIKYKVNMVGNKTPVYRDGYLTENNYIRDTSIEINCNLIKTSQLLPSTTKIIVRRGKQTETFNTEHVILLDQSKESNIRGDFNLNHHSEIVNNYQANPIIFEFQPNVQNDAEGKFYTLPNDKHTSDLERQSRTSAMIKDLNSQIINYLATTTIIHTLLGFITSAALIYICYKIITIIITGCTRKQEIIIKQVTGQIDTKAQATLSDYELTKIEAKKKNNIFPCLEPEQGKLIATTEQQ